MVRDVSRRALVLLSLALTLLGQLTSGKRAWAQLGRPAAPPPAASPSPQAPPASPAATAPSPAALPLAPAAPAPRALTREETSRLAAQIVAGRRASKRAASYAKRGRDRRALVEWQRAIEAYTAALALSGDAELRLPLSLAEEGRGDLVAAAHQLRFLLQTAGVRVEVTNVAAVRLESLYQRLARVTFAVAPARTVVYRGIVVVASTPMSGPLLLAPGAYTFRFEANGFRSKEVAVELAAGDDRRRQVELFPLAPLMPPIERDPELAAAAAASRPRISRVVLGGAAVTAALVVAAGTTGGMALYRHSQHDDEPQLARRRRLADSGERWSLATDVLVGAALLTAAGTAYYHFAVDAPRAERARAANAPSAAARPARRPPAAPRPLRLLPWATADSAGIGLWGAL